MKQPVIYKIRNVVNGKFYVGSTTDTRERFRTHRSRLRKGVHHCSHLQAAWNKYGEDCFKFEVQEVIEDAAKLWEAEAHWLAEHYGKSYCYNAGSSPDAPMRGRFGASNPKYKVSISEAQKVAISATLKAFYAEDPNNHPRLGKAHTEEAKAKISEKVNAAVAEGRGGKFIPTEETRQKMSASLKGNQNAKGYKRTDAEREAIRRRTLGNKNFFGKQHSEDTKEKLRRKLAAKLPDGTIREFAGVAAAGEELGVAYPMLVRSAKAGKPVARGVLAGWFFYYPDAPTEAPAIPDEYAHLPRTRQLAKEQGSPLYFTGLPCEHGHIAPRKVKGTCVECAKIEGQRSNEQTRLKKLAKQTAQ